MAASVFFNWPTAKRVGIRGQKVRRNGWTNKWWKYQGGLWWIVQDAYFVYDMGYPPVNRVVQNTDYTREDLLALDWTNMPVSCVTAALSDSGETCPKTVDPADPVYVVDPPYQPPTDPTDPTTPTDPTDPTDPVVIVDPPPPLPPDPKDPPPVEPPGGGGGGGGGGKPRPPRPPRPPIPGPTLTVVVSDTNTYCYGGGSELKSTTFYGTVTLGTTADPKANGGYFCTVRYGNTIVANQTLTPGGSFGFTYSVAGYPCSTHTFKARAWRSGVADVTASGSASFQPYCVHPISIHAYYRSEWGYHTCDAAVFDVDVNGIALGSINLNNGDDGGDRDAYLSATEEQMQAAFEVNPTITINFACALGYCHDGVAYVEVTDTVSGAVLFSGNQATATLELHFCPGL